MHRIIFFACTVAFSVAVTQAHAAPLVGFVVAAVGLSGAAATIVTGVLTLGLSFGVQYALAQFQPKPKLGSVPTGVQAEVQLGASVYHGGAFGEVATKGHYIYWNTSGTDNRWLDQVYRLATGWCEGLTGIIIDGKTCALSEVSTGHGWTKYAVTLPGDGGTRRMWVTFWEGRHDQQVNQALIASANPVARWTDDHIGTGICYAHVEAVYKAEVDAFRSLLSGQAITFVFKGLRLYDWRKDSTRGGSGSHRIDDWTTWEYSANPTVARYHYQRGYYINGALAWGQGLPAYDLLTDYYTAAANACDEMVTLDAGGAERRYEVSLIFSAGAEHIDTVDALDRAMAAQRLEAGGVFGLIAGVAQMPVATITDADLIAEEPVAFSAKRPADQLLNELWGQFTNPADLWSAADYPPIIGDAATKAEDGGEDLPQQQDFLQVPSGTQAQRLARIAYRRVRYQAAATIPLGLEARNWNTGEWIVWKSARYGNRTFVITDMSSNGAVVSLSLDETSVKIYGWAAADEKETPATPVRPATPSRPTNVNGLIVQPTSITGADGLVLPALAVAWDEITDDTITAVVLEHRVVGGGGEAVRTVVTRSPSGSFVGTVISAGILSGTDYEVRSTITTDPVREVIWSVWVPVTTSDEMVVGTAAGLYGKAREALERAERLAADVAARADEIAQAALAKAFADRAVIGTIEQRVSAVLAGLGSAQAAIVEEQTARVDGDTATASALTAVSASIDGLTTELQTYAESIAGLSTSYVLRGSVDGGSYGGFAFTGAQAPDGSGPEYTFAIRADRFLVLPPEGEAGDAVPPIVFEGGTAYFSNLISQSITADDITTGSIVGGGGQMEINLDAPFILMSAAVAP